MKNKKKFSKMLARLRKEKGLTQKQLADIANVSRRVIAYYEVESDNPPANLIIRLAKIFKVSTDDLLCIKPSGNNKKPPSLKITRRIKEIEDLPSTQQKALLKTIDTFLENIQLKKRIELQK